MSRKKIFFSLIFVCLVAAILGFVLIRQPEKSKASGGTDMFQEIDNMALEAKSGKPDAIGNLVDTIFAQHGVNLLDAKLVATLRERVVTAEVNGQTVTESQVVQSVNWLMGQFGAPTYAQTSLLQTRVLRNVSIGLMPNLFPNKDNSGTSGLARQVNSELSSEMSACQALTLVLFITQQKNLNEQFQTSPAQWDTDYIAQQRKGIPQGTSTPELISRPRSLQSIEMDQLIYETNRSPADQELIAQGVLDQLGIPR
jgi:hypothetical protein